MEFWTRYGEEILQRSWEHLVLVGTALMVAILIGIPLGILITRYPKFSQSILGFANVMQTIPSLALFGILLPIPIIGGIGEKTAIVALVLYSLLPIIRNTFVGIRSVDPSVREAGRGMGMSDRQILWQVEMPLAMSVILSGVRVATVIGIGLATIASAIGAGGLGEFIFRGVAIVDNQLILAGAIPAAIMALGADWILGWIERRLTVKNSKSLC
ncbi:MAG: ABC transporter permease [Leptolyngbya sp. Prado105]|nr:ABC transporter permease [Leptolyngbya sp. Prado105]